MDYANQIRPASVLVTACVDGALDTPWVIDEFPTRGEVKFRIAANIDPSAERKMRLALLKAPAMHQPWATLGDFAPWEYAEHPARRGSYHEPGSYFVNTHWDEVKRIDSVSGIS